MTCFTFFVENYQLVDDLNNLKCLSFNQQLSEVFQLQEGIKTTCRTIYLLPIKRPLE